MINEYAAKLQPMLLQPRYPLYLDLYEVIATPLPSLSRSLQIYPLGSFRRKRIPELCYSSSEIRERLSALRKCDSSFASEARLLFRVHRPWRNRNRNPLDVKRDRNKSLAFYQKQKSRINSPFNSAIRKGKKPRKTNIETD